MTKVYLTHDMNKALNYARKYYLILRTRDISPEKIKGAELLYKQAMKKLNPIDQITILNKTIR